MQQREASELQPVETWKQAVMVTVAFVWTGFIVVMPFANVFVQAFADGIGPFLANFGDPDFIHAIQMTATLAAVCVPVNTIFGIACAVEVARKEFPGKGLLLSLLDLPFSISPVVVGLMLILLYGREGIFAPILRHYGLNIVFAFPGMVIATLFVTLPFVAKELIPILEEQDISEEEAAKTLGASDWEVFWHVTLPNIKWGILYGVILTNARAMGEFGAVAVISGNIIGQTQTLTLFVESAYKEYNTTGAFASAFLLSLLAVVSLILKQWLNYQSSKRT